MAGIMDMLFRLTPVEQDTAEAPETQAPETPELPIIHNQVQYQEMTQPQQPAVQAGAPEDAKPVDGVSQDVQELLAARDKQIADLTAKVDMLLKFRGQSMPEETQEQTAPPLTPDAPSDYVPLRELDFVSKPDRPY